MEYVILVDENDSEIGKMEKIEAHRKGKLHRAFSIFVFNSRGELMIQRRAKSKYHCGGLWSNTCCSHPRPGETVLEAAHRRLMEEMGFDCELTEIFSFIYRSEFDNGLTEHEYDHVLIGFYDGEPKINPEEADDWKWVSPKEVLKDMEKSPEKYTYWFKVALPRVMEYLNTFYR